MIVISGEKLEELSGTEGTKAVPFVCREGEDVYSLLHGKRHMGTAVPGTVCFVAGKKNIPVSNIGQAEDCVRVVIRRGTQLEGKPLTAGFSKITGYVRCGADWQEAPVQIVPVKDELFSRNRGLLETSVLSDKSVAIFGLGSGGSLIALELAKSGVSRFFPVDHDRFELGNVVRHLAGISDIGRFKTKVMKDLILEKNPYADVKTSEEKVTWDNNDTIVRPIVRQADIVVCATDGRASKLVINKVCVEEEKPCLFAGAFRRAYGGQVLFVRPYESPCYQCFLMLLPEVAKDEEISSREHAHGLAYTDRPVPIEPGLSTDIAPICLLVVKLVIQEMLKGTETTLRSLDEDLVAPWYLWLNRREVGTQYEKLSPLEHNVGGMHILRWYGIDLRRHPGCPVCGSFEEHLATQYSLGDDETDDRKSNTAQDKRARE